MPISQGGAEAIIRPVGDVEEIQVVGALASGILEQLGVHTDARSVWLHQDVVGHIHKQRQARKRPIETGDAEFSLQHIPATILRPHYCGLDKRDETGRRIDLVRMIAGTGRHLFVSVKVVSAAEAGAPMDEIWVCTAHPLGPNFLTQERYKDRFQPVQWTRT